ncbi:MAG: very short patch repair endonuclease [bacterium]|nr:very short patch repair endonuclease [bacterium]
MAHTTHPSDDPKLRPPGTEDDSRPGLDPLTARQRSELMSRIRSKDTRPEMLVRRLVHGMGYRYRLHAKELPGRPDLVFRPQRKAILVHGCFWHRHEGCPANRMPKTRREFWSRKLNGNARRDQRNKETLEREGWQVLIIWECETKDLDRIARVVRRFLGPVGGHPA